MARIRSIKPEFWDSKDVAKCSLRGRLLYIAMWNWADDYGIGDATPVRLLGFAFPNDAELPTLIADFPPLREEIAERFGVVFFEHEGRPYFHLTNFDKHQRTEKKAKQRIPFPDDLENAAIPTVAEKVAEVPTHSGGSSDAGRRKGEEGTGEEGRRKVTRASAPEHDDPLPPVFLKFCETYPGDVATTPALAAWISAIKRNKGQAQPILDGALAYAEHAAAKGTEPKFFRNAVKWLNEDGWKDRLKTPSRAAPQTRASEHMQLANRLAAQESGPKEIAQ